MFNCLGCKNRMTDAIFVINKNGYIGDSTLSEIKYAQEHSKPILYMERIVTHTTSKK